MRIDREVELAKFTAWHAAMLPYFKKKMDLAEFLAGPKGPPGRRQQTPDEMLVNARAWVAAITEANKK